MSPSCGEPSPPGHPPGYRCRLQLGHASDHKSWESAPSITSGRKAKRGGGWSWPKTR